MKPKNWMAVVGRFERDGDTIIFPGIEPGLPASPVQPVANIVSDLTFGAGTLSCTITFSNSTDQSAAGLILFYHPGSGEFIEVQLGGPLAMCSLMGWSGQRWIPFAIAGVPGQLESGLPYEVSVRAAGSRVRVSLNHVELLDSRMPSPLPIGQAGIWAYGTERITFDDFRVNAQPPEMFVVMQYEDRYDELYQDVIRPIGAEMGYDVIRADDMYGPGIIITEIERHIQGAAVVVADVTPVNANVYWEVGYARAMNKPTVLLAERGTELPFDISPFRAFWYENTIGGKSRLELDFRKALTAISESFPAR